MGARRKMKSVLVRNTCIFECTASNPRSAPPLPPFEIDPLVVTPPLKSSAPASGVFGKSLHQNAHVLAYRGGLGSFSKN